MMRTIRCVGIAFLLLGCTSSTDAQMHFWMSSSGLEAGSSVGEVPSVKQPRGGSGELFIWAKPEDGKVLQNFSLNLTSTSETAIEFESAVVANGGRFAHVFDTDNGLDISDQAICTFPPADHGLWGLTGLNLMPESGTGLNADAADSDPNYNADTETWLLATIGYSGAVNGTADLYLEVGQIGMNYVDELATEMTVLLGSLRDATLDNAPDDRCTVSATADATIEVVDPMLGDFNLNGILDAPDIDLLSEEVWAKTNNAMFDLVIDGVVDQKDRKFWVESLRKTNFGDAGFTGVVDFSDFLVLSANFDKVAGWAGGNFVDSELVEFDDFLVLSANFDKGTLFEAAELASVPEPRAMLECGCLLTVALLRLTKRRRHEAAG